jgi:pimeloyl-ACP methyl ester carboxylesterase
LAWSPAWEAYYYESIHLGVWDDVDRLDPNLPILVVGGSESDTFLPATQARFKARAPWAEMAVVGGGHLFPQSAPAPTAAVLTRWLGKVVANGRS